MKFKPYPKYKPSGVSWIPRVPEGWSVSPLKWLVYQLNEKPEATGDTVEYVGMENIESFSGKWIPASSNDEPSGLGNVFKAGDVLFGKLRPYLAKAWRANRSGICSSELLVLRPRTIDGRFLLQQVLNQDFINLVDSSTYGSKMPRASWDFIGAIKLPVPSQSEQEAIAAFLDRETAKIDTLIAKQEKLIELLKEKRQAVISHAVTKGLDPTVPMKPSGVEWLGDVPEHWKMTRIRFLFRQEKRQDHIEKPVLSVYRDYGVILKNSRDDNMNKTPEDLSAYQLVNPGDLVVNKMKAWQGSLGVSDFEGITSPDYVVFAPCHRECSTFLHLLFRSERMVSIYRSISNGIRPAQWRLEPDLFLGLPVFLPPEQEQLDLVSFITDRTSKFDTLIAKAEQAITLQKEHRTALISAAVTGKIDVREAESELQEAA